MSAEFITVIRQGEKLGALFIGVAEGADQKLEVKQTILDADVMFQKSEEGRMTFLSFFNSRGIGEFTIGHALAEIIITQDEIKKGIIPLERIPTVEEFMRVLASSKPEPLAP